MEGLEEISNKKQIKTNDSKKKPVKADKKKEDPLTKGSPKRKNPPKKNVKKDEKPLKSIKKKDDSFELINELLPESSSSDEDSSEEFISKTKAKTTKQKPQAKKEKTEKIQKPKGTIHDDGTSLVFEYMRKQNRPYSLINILDNLHGEIKKAQGQKILDQLSEEKELQMKEYGKAKIYLINQKNIPLMDPIEMETLKNVMNEKKNEHGTLVNEIKVLKKKETDLNFQLSNEQIEMEIEKYVDLLKECDERIEGYQSPSYIKIPDEVINEAECKKNKYEKEYKKRKRYCTDMINQLSEGMEKKPREIEEMIGIERD